jgi:uncharacterized protein YukE
MEGFEEMLATMQGLEKLSSYKLTWEKQAETLMAGLTELMSTVGHASDNVEQTSEHPVCLRLEI